MRTKNAVIMAESGQSLPHGELESRVMKFADVLGAEARSPQRVAILLPNQIEYLVVVMGARRAGFDFLPLNHHASLREQLAILGRLNPTVVVASDQFIELVDGLAAQLPSSVRRILIGSPREGWEHYQALLEASTGMHTPTEKQGKLLLLSGGCTGESKIVVRGKADRRPERTFGIDLQDDDVALVTAPLYHTMPMGWMLSSIDLGIPVVICERWNTQVVLQAIQQYRVTLLSLVPTTMGRLVSLPEDERSRYDLSSLRFVRHGAAPCPVAVKQSFIEWLPWVEVSEIYGMSEGIGRCHIGRDEWLERPGSVGRPMAGYKVIIRNDDGQELPPYQPGIIWFCRADNERMHYLGNPEETAACYNEYGEGTGWDIGYVDDEGYLYLVDRRKRMITVGGVNVYPAKIEEVLRTHPDVSDAHVMGSPDNDLGQVPVAVVELCERRGPEVIGALKVHCRGQLGGLLVPRRIVLVDQLPREPTGKIRNEAVRQLLEV